MATILVKVQAKTGNRQIIDYRDGVLKILAGEPPVDGKANAAVIDLLSQALWVRCSQINLILTHYALTNKSQQYLRSRALPLDV